MPIHREPVALDVLQRRAAQIRETRRRCGFGAVGEQLPDLIRDIHCTIAAGRDVKALVELAVIVHVHVTLMWLAGMIGMVTMTRSLIAAADQRPGDVAAPMQAAKELAGQFGEPDDDHDRLGFGFGPTNVGLWEMALALEAAASPIER